MNKKTALAAPKRLSLSDATIQTYPLPARGTVRVSDTECRGLAIRITSKGVKTFTVRHQRAGKRVLTSIGTYPSMSVHEARIKATELVSNAPAGPSNRTASDLFENVYWPMREREVRESTAYNSMCQYKLRIKGHIGHLPVSEIAKRDIVAMQDEWREEMKSIAVPQMVISHFFNWLMEREYIAVSPVPRTKITRKPRERIMMLSELRELWQWADSFGDGLFADMNATMKL